MRGPPAVEALFFSPVDERPRRGRSFRRRRRPLQPITSHRDVHGRHSIGRPRRCLERPQKLADARRRLHTLQTEETLGHRLAVELLSKIKSDAVERLGWEPGEPIASGALVTLTDESENERSFLLLPLGAGLKLERAGVLIQVITPTSPLGEALLGQGEDDSVEVFIGGARRDWDVVAVI